MRVGKFVRAAVCALTLAGVAEQAEAWWCDGHMLVASVAYQLLSPKTKSAVNPLIASLASTYPASPDFITSACWADDLKTLAVTEYNAFHFVDLPVLRGPIWFAVPAVGNASNNPWAIQQGLITLYSNSSVQLDKARQLRFIVHFVGDLHQPLHAAQLFSPQFQNGDAGGNLFYIAGVLESDLHAYWDSGAEQWYGDLSRPLNATGQAWVDNFTQQLLVNFPPSYFGSLLNITDPFMWAGESRDIADSFVYSAPQSPTPLPASYKTQAAQICLERVTLGGYRLAAMLERVFNPTPKQIAEREAVLAEVLALAENMRDDPRLRDAPGH